MAVRKFIGFDLFSGAGGMSIGAIQAGVNIKFAVELDRHAAFTFSKNHPEVKVYNQDIQKFEVPKEENSTKNIKIVFGGPPCQGFSTSNQKTRSLKNRNNLLLKDFLRVSNEVKPDWIVIENVKGIFETESGYFFEKTLSDLRQLGYTPSYKILNAVDFEVPQFRNRVFIVASRHGIQFEFPAPAMKNKITVKDAISDLPILFNGADYLELNYKSNPVSGYQKSIRQGSKKSANNFVTKNNKLVIERYKHIPPGGNWENIPPKLMKNYKDFSRCHTKIYYRLKEEEPSVVLGNYRKNMLIHPSENRGLSVREAARIQSFPDTFKFYGSIGFQQQQVGNSVPPRLAKAIFEKITKYQ